MKLKIAVVLAVTVACLVAVLWGLDLSVAGAALSQTRWGFLVPMAALYLTAHGLRSLRLGVLLGEPVGFWRLYSINAVGFLAINVIPLRLGEFVRPYLLSEREGVAFGRAMAAIVLERLLDMAMLLVMLLGLTWMVDLPAGGVVVQGVDVVRAGQRVAGTLVVAGAMVGAVLVFVGEPAIRLLERLPLGGKFAGFARRFREGFLTLVASPARAAAGLGLTIGVWGLTLAAVAVVMAAFPGIPVGVGPVWSTWTITLAGMTAVPTPGFFGSYEAFCTAALWLWQVDADLARTFALVLHLGQFAFSIALGGIFVLVEGLSLRQLVRPAEAPAP